MSENILLVEDDEIKANEIVEFIKILLDKQISFSRKASWQSAIQEIVKNTTYSLILLDMSMPRFELEIGDVYEEFESFAGLDVLKEMKRRKIVIPTIVITAFDEFGEENKISFNELRNILKDEFKEYCLGITYFKSGSSKWKEDLRKIILEEEK